MLDTLLRADRDVLEAVRSLRWGPLTDVARAASWWWVKGPLLVVVGLLCDLRARRAPIAALTVLVAWWTASGLTSLAKEVVDRARPSIADPAWTALIATPGSASFPSGHASTAFAGATVLALLAPRLRVWVLLLAAAVALSRVYLGVHFPLDVLVGALLGASVGAVAAGVARRVAPAALG